MSEGSNLKIIEKSVRSAIGGMQILPDNGLITIRKPKNMVKNMEVNKDE